MAAGLLFTATALQSCLDYDTPGDEFSQTQEQIDDEVYHGEAENINFNVCVSTEAGFKALVNSGGKLYQPISQAQGGVYAMRGGKDGNPPGAHSYQRQYCFGPDLYAQYGVVPHTDFMYGNFGTSYCISKDFSDGPNGCYSIVRNAIVPLLNHPQVDSIPELKAMFLLLYDYSSVEIADMYGTMPYFAYLNNQQVAPFEYDGVEAIYNRVVEHIDTINACLRNYQNRPTWYKTQFVYLVNQKMPITLDAIYGGDPVEMMRRFANSFKLRLAMHIVKVDRAKAQKWAEQAVLDGVIETMEQEVGLFTKLISNPHPLQEIAKSWGDWRVSASYITVLNSYHHPFLEYVFDKNSTNITRQDDAVAGSSAPEVTPANSVVVGMREGAQVGHGQSVAGNPFIAFSIPGRAFVELEPPMYLMKLSEVLYLRAEGALRGWNMGGDAKDFYYRAIDYSDIIDRDWGTNGQSEDYAAAMDDYKNIASPYPYTYVNPTGLTPDEASPVTVGVKWNDSDTQEQKLEKIITQKWISQFPCPIEPWNDLRRTGYPKLFPVLNPGDGDGSLAPGDIIRRITFSSADEQTKQDIAATGLSALGGPDLQATRVWWDIDAPNF